MFFKKKCFFCNRKTKESRTYWSDAGKKIHACRQCTAYAERRAYRRA